MSESQVHPEPASLLRPTWFEIDLDAVAHNLRQLRRMVGSGVAIYACLKRNAYGCGAVQVAEVMQREGADAIAVGNIPGRILYGIKPSPVASRDLPMHPAVRTFKSRLILAKWFEPEDAGGFAGPFPVRERRRIGVLPLGWGDGIPRRIPGQAEALVGGKRVPVVGPVHLEHMRVDLTDVPGAKVGDEAVFLGTQGDDTITLDQLAEGWAIDALDFLGGMRDHIARVYIRDGTETASEAA